MTAPAPVTHEFVMLVFCIVSHISYPYSYLACKSVFAAVNITNILAKTIKTRFLKVLKNLV
jgi:hypothetical protein